MELTFGTYTRRIKLYYIFIILMIVLLAAAIAFYDMQLPDIYVQILVGLSLAIFVIRSFIPYKIVKMYIPDGEVKISAERIIINSIIIPTEQIKTLGIKIADYEGNKRGTSDGSGNKIQVTDKNGRVLSTNFIIKTFDEMREIKTIVEQWKESNISVEPIMF